VNVPEAIAPSALRVVRFTSFGDLAPHAQDWDRLSQDIPFRNWSWMSCWWRHYGQRPAGGSRGSRLYVLGVLDDADRLIGVAPWFMDAGSWRGRVLRFLGSGEVCPEYLTVPAARGREGPVAAALADWLTAARGADAWDLLELTAVDGKDTAIARLAQRLEAGGNLVHRRAGPSCWRIALPKTYDEYLATLSKHHRNHLRKAERRLLASGRAVVHRVQEPEDLPRGEQVLIGLHQARWRALGQPGCFSSERYAAFHAEVLRELLARGQLLLFWIELDGKPLAVEYLMAAGDTLFHYQRGLDVSRLEDSPGRLGTIVTLRLAIDGGYRALDMLRGDEPYKAHFRAQPNPCLEIRAVPAVFPARVRHGIWLAGSSAKHWLAARRAGSHHHAVDAES
jgi:CelD/BcsL family acetyltransferase involved in cellulose biosynthesis